MAARGMNYAPLLPLHPTEEEAAEMWERWKPRQYIVYRSDWWYNGLTEMKERAVRCHCSACGGSWITDRSRACGNNAPFGFWTEDGPCGSNHDTICPQCGEKVRSMHVGSFQYRLLDEKWFMTAGKVRGRFVLLGWLLQHEVDKAGCVYRSIKPYEAYVVEEKKVVKLTAYDKVITAIHLTGQWRQLARCVDTWLEEPELVGFRPEDLIGTTAENSKLDLYMRTTEKHFPVSYLRLWCRHPRVENLMTAGAGNYVAMEIVGSTTYAYAYSLLTIMPGIPNCNDVNWKERKPTKMLDLNRNELRVMINMKWSGRRLRIYKGLRAQGPVKLPQDMLLTYGEEMRTIEAALEKGWPVLKMLRYCEKKPEWDLQTLMDYWTMAEAGGINLADDSLRWPKDLRRQHNKALVYRRQADALKKIEQKRLAIEKRRPAFEKTAAFCERFCFASDGILIRPCRTEEELIREGELLSHCVAMYADKIAAGESMILFVRREDAPEAPWYTLELDLKDLQVLQNRGKCNCEETLEVKAFVALWKKTMFEKKGSAA